MIINKSPSDQEIKPSNFVKKWCCKKYQSSKSVQLSDDSQEFIFQNNKMLEFAE
jgi:hypothetical protein